MSLTMTSLAPASKAAALVGSRDRPALAILVDAHPLNRPGSAKDVHHVVLDLSATDVTYAAGDSLGVFARKNPKLVQSVLADLDTLIERFEREATRRGATVLFARTREEARDLVLEICRRHRFRVVNIFHAGDGNLHPLILYNANDRAELERAEMCGAEILKLCVKLGGCLTGEHGVGIEKRDLMPVMFNETDLGQQMRVKCAFDSQSLLNPGKVFPQLRRCAEEGRVHVHHGATRFPELPRF